MNHSENIRCFLQEYQERGEEIERLRVLLNATEENEIYLVMQRAALLKACKAVSPVLEGADSWTGDDHTIAMDKHDWRRLKRQIAAAIAAVEGNDADSTADA